MNLIYESKLLPMKWQEYLFGIIHHPTCKTNKLGNKYKYSDLTDIAKLFDSPDTFSTIPNNISYA